MSTPDVGPEDHSQGRPSQWTRPGQPRTQESLPRCRPCPPPLPSSRGLRQDTSQVPPKGLHQASGGGYASRSSLSLRSSTEPLCSSSTALHCVGRGPGTQGVGKLSLVCGCGRQGAPVVKTARHPGLEAGNCRQLKFSWK